MANRRPQGKSTVEQVDKSLETERLRVISFGLIAMFLGLTVLLRWGITPLARTIAGTQTDFNLNISLVVNVGLAVSTAIGGAASYELNRRRRHHQRRARDLEKELKEARAELKKGGKHNG